MNKQKIFCIGLNKTGTTSLHAAFKILGLRSCHNSEIAKEYIEQAKKNKKKLLHFFDNFDAYSDIPFCFIYKDLDKQYPNSKFILTVRDNESWLKSLISHARRNRERIDLDGNLKQKIKSEKEIRDYFKENKNFLVLDIIEGDGWRKLCPFLDVAVPNISFPFKNRGNIILRALNRIKRICSKKDDSLF